MSDDNQKNLCAYIEEELPVKYPKSYIALIQPVKDYCQGCGRNAAKAENLRKPQMLP